MKYDARACKFNMDTGYFMFVSFPPYDTFTVVTFVIRSFF